MPLLLGLPAVIAVAALAAAAGRVAHPGSLVERPECARQPAGAAGTAVVAGHRDRLDGDRASCSAYRWPGCWPARGFRPRRCSGRLITVPLVLPPVVGGVALFTVLGRSGLLGRPLYELTGFAFPFTPYAVVLAQVFVALPFLVLSVEGALRAADRRFEEAAATLGARPITVFRRVTLPLVGPGIAAGAVLGLGPRAGRVRRDDHLRRQLPRDHPDHAAGGLPGPGDRSRMRPCCCRCCCSRSRSPCWSCFAIAGSPGGSRASSRSLRLHSAGLPRSFASARSLDARLDSRSARRGRRPARPQRRRQVDRPARPRRAAARSTQRPDRGRRTRCWPTPRRAGTSPPHERPIGMVFQDYLLFPHLSVLDNVAFGPRRPGRAPERRPGERAAGLAGPDRHRRPRLRPAASDLRRSGAAGRAGPGAGHRPGGCCCSTSRWPLWTPGPGCRSAVSCAGISPTYRVPRWWSPTTRSTRRCWAIGWW